MSTLPDPPVLIPHCLILPCNNFVWQVRPHSWKHSLNIYCLQLRKPAQFRSSHSGCAWLIPYVILE